MPNVSFDITFGQWTRSRSENKIRNRIERLVSETWQLTGEHHARSFPENGDRSDSSYRNCNDDHRGVHIGRRAADANYGNRCRMDQSKSLMKSG